MKFRKIYIVILALLAVGVFFFIKNSGVIPVNVAKLENKMVKRSVSASGVVKAQNEVDLSFSATGKVSTITTEKGAFVKKGQYLAMIDNYSESKGAAAYKEALDIAIRDKEIYVQDYSTNLDAVGGEEEYYLNLKRLDQLIEKARATYQSQIGGLSRTYIYAPFDGTIIDVYKEVGETAAIGESVIKIADLNQLMFEIELDQEDFGLLEEGQKVEINLDTFDDRTYTGEVKDTPKYVDSTNGTDFVIKIMFSDQDKDKLLLGMTGDAYIILASTDKEVPALTFDDIIYDIEDNPYVFINAGGRAKKQSLELGLQGDIYTEIKNKLEGDVISPVDTKKDLTEGVKVKVVNR